MPTVRVADRESFESEVRGLEPFMVCWHGLLCFGYALNSTSVLLAVSVSLRWRLSNSSASADLFAAKGNQRIGARRTARRRKDGADASNDEH